jgi:hypothetical protein
MFGKPNWFIPKTSGWGLRPITWQGWAYTLGWAGVIAVPFLILLLRPHAGGFRVAEAGIWMLASMSALFFDVRLIRQQLLGTGPKPAVVPATAAKPVSDILYIGDDKEPIATRNFQLRRKG